MKITEVAQLTGLSNKAIRYYEQKGLISAPRRSANGYRRYDEPQLEQLRLLKQARLAGFSLQECREFIQLLNNPLRQSGEVKAKTLAKVSQLQQQIAALQAIHDRLSQLASRCPGDGGAECPIIDDFTRRR